MHNIDLQEEDLNFTIQKMPPLQRMLNHIIIFFKAATSIAIILKLMNEHAMKNFRYISNS